MDSIAEEVEIGRKKDMSVFLEASIGGTTVLAREGDSFLGNLIYFMCSSAQARQQATNTPDVGLRYFSRFENKIYDDNYNIQRPYDKKISGDQNDYGAHYGITGVSGGSPVTVDIESNGHFSGIYGGNNYSSSDLEAVSITNVRGNNNLNGTHTNFTFIDGDTVEIPVSLTGNEDISNAYLAWIWSIDTITNNFYGQINWNDEGYFMGANLIFGRSDEPNGTLQGELNETILEGSSPGDLQYNPLTINEPDINLNQQTSTIIITREVKNNTSSDIVVSEAGITLEVRSEDYDDHFYQAFAPITRDVVNQTIPADTTVSFTYKVRTTCENDGGITTNLNEMLYRHFAATNRTVRDVSNSDQNDGPSVNQFRSLSRGGDLSNRAGVMVGTATDPVDEGNTSLFNEVPLGKDDGELYRVGSYVSGIQQDLSNSKVYFDLVSIFENRGATTIGINEIAWYSNGPSGLVMIARALTSSQKDVAPGDFIEARYRISVQL